MSFLCGENKLKYDFDNICKKLKDYCKQLGYLPSQKEIDNNSDLPHHSTINKLFKKNSDTYTNYQEYCRSLGYISKAYPYRSLCVDDLHKLWEKFYNINRRYPNSSDFNEENGLPTFAIIYRILGDQKDHFFNYYKNCNDEIIKKLFVKECQKLKEYCLSINYVLGMRELTSHGFHSSQWFINHSPNNIKTYSNFIEYIGLRPQRHISKECATKLVYNKLNKLDRPLKLEDFCQIDSIDEIGRPTIKRIWGTFNNMLTDLDLPINQKNMTDKHKDIEELKNDIKGLCERIYQKEDRRIISLSDIEEDSLCMAPGTYTKYFKQELNMTTSEYIESIGFKANKCGMGMVYKFNDGEITVSKYEYTVSNYLRNINIKYQRNVPYSKFINYYDGNKDCDYVIDHDGTDYYIEIAGMLDYTKMNKNKKDKIRESYEKHIQEKVTMLNSKKLNYQIIYPHELKTRSLDEIFSFLFMNAA